MNSDEKICQIESRIKEGQSLLVDPSSTTSDFSRWENITLGILNHIFPENPDLVRTFARTASDHPRRVWNSANDPEILNYVRSMIKNKLAVLNDMLNTFLKVRPEIREKIEIELLTEAEDDSIGLAKIEANGACTILLIGKQKNFEGEQYSKSFNDMIDQGLIIHEEGQRYRISLRGKQYLESKTNREQPIPSPALQYTTEIVQQALEDAERLITTSGPASAVDRAYTSIHGYLKNICSRFNLNYETDQEALPLYKAISSQHPAFAEPDKHNHEIKKINNSIAAILVALNRLRDEASLAHPNELLEKPEAWLAVNIAKTILRYCDEKLSIVTDNVKHK